MKRFILVTSLSLVAPAACSQSGEIGDPDGPATSAPPTVQPVGSSGVPGGGTVKRTVETRNPFGVPADNLFYDGDFELSTSPGGGQFGWVVLFSSSGDDSLVTETGGLCRSGLRCGVVEDGQTILGRAVAAAEDGNMEMSLYAKPKDKNTPCPSVLDVSILYCDNITYLDTMEADPDPDESGWCRLHATIPATMRPPCLLIEPETDALIDAATLLPAGSAAQSSSATAAPLDPSREQRIARAREWIRTHPPVPRTFPAVKPADAQRGP